MKVNITESKADVIALSVISWGNVTGDSPNPYQLYNANGSAVKITATSSGNSSGVYNASIVRTLAYQSVFDAFGKVLAGSISLDYMGRPIINDTSIVSTLLFDTVEKTFLNSEKQA